MDFHFFFLTMSMFINCLRFASPAEADLRLGGQASDDDDDDDDDE